MIYEHEIREGSIKNDTINTQPFPKHTMLDDTQIVFEYLEGRGLNGKLALDNGWYLSRSAGDWESRIVMPATSQFPGHNYWQARAIETLHKRDDGKFDVVKRYQSPRCARLDALIVVYPKYDLFEDKSDQFDTAVIVEGPMDALAAAGEGVLGIALMGATPGAVVLDHLAARVKGLHAIIVADRDALDLGHKLVDELLQRDCVPSFRFTPVGYKDLAETPKELRSKIWTSTLT